MQCQQLTFIVRFFEFQYDRTTKANDFVLSPVEVDGTGGSSTDYIILKNVCFAIQRGRSSLVRTTNGHSTSMCVNFCVHMYNLIRQAPSPTFSDTAIFESRAATFISLRNTSCFLTVGWKKLIKHVPPLRSRTHMRVQVCNVHREMSTRRNIQ